MKDINEIITLENIKGFLKTLGYDWKGVYYHQYIKGEDEPKKAEKVSELVLPNVWTMLFTEITVNEQKQSALLYANFDFDYFILCKEQERLDRKAQISEPKNYTKEWIMFLIEENGKKYVKALTDSLNEQMINLIDKNEEKNEKLQQQIEKNNNKLKRDLKEISSLMKDINKKAEKLNKDDNKTK